MKGYGEDLALIHDVGFTEFARGTAPGVLALLRRGGVRAGLVVDLGCGSGVWAAALARAGYDVIGIDQSAAMIRLARRRVPRGRFRRGSLFRAHLPPCDAVTALGECVSYLFDGAGGWRGLRRLLRRVHAALRPGGMLIFDFAAPGRVGSAHRGGADRNGGVARGDRALRGGKAGRGRRSGDDAASSRSYREGRGWAVLVESRENVARTQLTRRIVAYRKRAGAYRRSEEIHRLRLFHRDDVARALRKSGFVTRRLRAYGRYRLGAGLVAFAAHRPESRVRPEARVRRRAIGRAEGV